MSKKTDSYAEAARSLIESLIKENSELHDVVGEMQGIAVKYDALAQAVDDAIMADTDGVFLVHGNDILTVYKSLEPCHYLRTVSRKMQGDDDG